MAEQLLRASSAGIQRVTAKLKEKDYNITQFTEELKIPKQLVEKFFQGQEVDRRAVLIVCKKLELPWQEIIDLKDLSLASTATNAATIDPTPHEHAVQSINLKLAVESDSDSELDLLVQKFRKRLSSNIEIRCDRLRMLDMQNPILLSSIYIDTYVLNQTTASQRLKIEELTAEFSNYEGKDFGFTKVGQELIKGLAVVEQNSKVMLLGKLGSGKTIFLHELALQCNAGQFMGDRIPILFSLKDLSEISDQSSQTHRLLVYLKQYLADYEFTDDQTIHQLLEKGKFLFLLDGLDEVKNEHSHSLVGQISDFCDRFPLNHFVITCRVGSQPYTLGQFTEFEIADFSFEQVQALINRWFKTLNSEKAKKLIGVLDNDLSLKELSNNPLALTLMCSAFAESEGINSLQICEELVSLMLKTWDAKRLIERDGIKNNLSIHQKTDILEYIALTTLRQGQYFVKKNELEAYIQICADKNLDSLLLTMIDSESLIESLEIQHNFFVERAKGIYSFSHITLQKYLAARQIANSKELDIIARDAVTNIQEEFWPSIIPLAVSFLPNADAFLLNLKGNIDNLLAEDKKLQKFLIWIDQQAQTIQSPYKQVAIRAYYLDLDLENTRVLDKARAVDLAHGRTVERARLRSMGKEHELNTEMDVDHSLMLALNLDLAFFFLQNPILALARNLDPKVNESLNSLQNQVPYTLADTTKFGRWWQTKGMQWAKQLRDVIIQPRKGIQEWEFTDAQVELLKKYHDANLLLVKCLNNASQISENVSAKAQVEIESTLLKAIAKTNTNKTEFKP